MSHRSPKLQWGSQYVTGIKTIDEQHHVLFDLINDLQDAIAADTGHRGVETALQALIAYTLYHFVAEESLAVRAGVQAHMADHVAQHQNFTRRIAAFRESAASGDALVVARDLLRYLKHWLVAHILRTDMELAREIDALGTAGRRRLPDEGEPHLRIAVVEDDDDLREEMVFLLSHVGHRAVALKRGEDLERLMKDAGCDVALLDLDLKDMDGLELLRRWGGRDDLAVVALAGGDTADDRVAGFAGGADAWLAKPIDMRELVAVVERVARRLEAGRAAAG